MATPTSPKIQVLAPGLSYQGMVSAKDPSQLNPGQVQLGKNVRGDTGVVIVRRGEVSVITKPSAATSAAPLWIKAFNLNGSVYVVGVFSDGTYGRVYVCPSTLDRWVEVSNAASWTGPSGNNRFTNIASTTWWGTVIKTPRLLSTGGTYASRDVLLIQNGEDTPRLFDPDTPNQAAALTVTAVANSGGLFQLTVGSHSLSAGDHVWIASVGGLSQLTGIWEISATTSTKITLKNSTFAAGYTSGGSVYDRADLLVHKPITDPTSQGASVATSSSYWQVSSSSGKTYAGTGVINQARFKLSDSATAPYNGADACLLATWTTSAAANDIATVQFSAGLTHGKVLAMLVEGKSSLEFFNKAKIETNPDNVAYGSISSAYDLVFDPANSDATRSTIVTSVQDSANYRYWVFFDTSKISGNSAYHARFTRVGAAPGGNQTATILGIWTGSGDIPSTTEWALYYEDEYNKSEGRKHAMLAKAEPINNIGGPKTVTNGAATDALQAPTIPLLDNYNSDWRFQVGNTSGSSPLNGGLDGKPQQISICAKLPGQDTYYYLTAYSLWTTAYNSGVRAWVISYDTSTYGNTLNLSLSAGVTQAYVNINRPAPSDFHSCIPTAAAGLFANARLFCGNVKDAASQYGRADGYFSWLRNPFRFQQVEDDEMHGGYVQVSGEKIIAYEASASAALGAGRIYLFTDQNIYVHGESGPFATAGNSTSDLSRLARIGPHGTLNANTISQAYSVMFWVDQDYQVIRMDDGGPVNISRNQVSDRLDNMASAYVVNLSAVFRKDRYYLCYTPSGATTNTRVLVWSENLSAWESEDYATTNTIFTNIFNYPAANGSVNIGRLMFADSNGTVYAYAEDASTGVAVKISTAGFEFRGWSGWYIGECWLSCTQQASGTMTIDRISRRWGSTEAWRTAIKLDVRTSSLFNQSKDDYAPVKQGAVRGSQEDSEWYIDLYGTLTPDNRLIRFEYQAVGITPDAGGR